MALKVYIEHISHTVSGGSFSVYSVFLLSLCIFHASH
jgi:hypothetical protein